MFVDANIFQPLISVFQSVLVYFHNNVGVSWGLAIIMLTVCVRLVMMPLTVKQFQGMRRMQQHQPEMKAIQQRYKQDKQRQQQELMKFYQENQINPLASCLPLVAQIPVFISLFYMLRKNLLTDICPKVETAFQHHYATLHHITFAAAAGNTTPCGNVPGAGFLFIKDITDKAHGSVLVVLCVLYVATQLVSTLLMSAPTMDRNQRRLMAALPLLFVLFIIRFPAGLLIYWITTNTWTMVQQFTLKQVIGAPIIPEVIDADSGPGSSSRYGASKPSGRLTGSDTIVGRPSTPNRLGSLFTPRPPRTGNGQVSSNEPAGSSTTAAPRKPSGPPPSSRKKKKRSGRRR